MALKRWMTGTAVLVLFAPVAQGQRATGRFHQTLTIRTISHVTVRTGAGRIEIRMG